MVSNVLQNANLNCRLNHDQHLTLYASKNNFMIAGILLILRAYQNNCLPSSNSEKKLTLPWPSNLPDVYGQGTNNMDPKETTIATDILCISAMLKLGLWLNSAAMLCRGTICTDQPCWSGTFLFIYVFIRNDNSDNNVEAIAVLLHLNM